MIKIKGFQGLSLIDYPERICCVVFTSGCNMRCPFCQNPELVSGDSKLQDEDKILEKIIERKGFIDGVVITGGEPTIQKGLVDFCKRIKDGGFFVKIDTNGLLPDVLKGLIDVVDYISLDIKASFRNYAIACGKEIGVDNIKESLMILKNTKIDYEIRTTCVPGIITEGEIKEIASAIFWTKRFVLQQFRNTKTLDPSFEKIEPYPAEILFGFKNEAENFIPCVKIRGI